MLLKNSFIKQALACLSNSSWVQELTNFAPQQNKTRKKETKIQLNIKGICARILMVAISYIIQFNSIRCLHYVGYLHSFLQGKVPKRVKYYENEAVKKQKL